MDSVPPATATCARPPAIASWASAMAWRPLEQKRFTVMAEALCGMPARRLAMRATFIPCSASGIAQPRMTSSTISAFTAGTRASAPVIATAARSSGRVRARVPFPALPTAVRTDATITGRHAFHG